MNKLTEQKPVSLGWCLGISLALHAGVIGLYLCCASRPNQSMHDTVSEGALILNFEGPETTIASPEQVVTGAIGKRKSEGTRTAARTSNLGQVEDL